MQIASQHLLRIKMLISSLYQHHCMRCLPPARSSRRGREHRDSMKPAHRAKKSNQGGHVEKHAPAASPGTTQLQHNTRSGWQQIQRPFLGPVRNCPQPPKAAKKRKNRLTDVALVLPTSTTCSGWFMGKNGPVHPPVKRVPRRCVAPMEAADQLHHSETTGQHR